MPDDLYDCYLLFMEESKKGILGILGTKKQKDFFLETHKPMSRGAFNQSLTKMKPKQRADFEEELRTPHQERKKNLMRAERSSRS